MDPSLPEEATEEEMEEHLVGARTKVDPEDRFVASHRAIRRGRRRTDPAPPARTRMSDRQIDRLHEGIASAGFRTQGQASRALHRESPKERTESTPDDPSATDPPRRFPPASTRPRAIQSVFDRPGARKTDPIRQGGRPHRGPRWIRATRPNREAPAVATMKKWRVQAIRYKRR